MVLVAKKESRITCRWKALISERQHRKLDQKYCRQITGYQWKMEDEEKHSIKHHTAQESPFLCGKTQSLASIFYDAPFFGFLFFHAFLKHYDEIVRTLGP